MFLGFALILLISSTLYQNPIWLCIYIGYQYLLYIGRPKWLCIAVNYRSKLVTWTHLFKTLLVKMKCIFWENSMFLNTVLQFKIAPIPHKMVKTAVKKESSLPNVSCLAGSFEGQCNTFMGITQPSEKYATIMVGLSWRIRKGNFIILMTVFKSHLWDFAVFCFSVLLI